MISRVVTMPLGSSTRSRFSMNTRPLKIVSLLTTRAFLLFRFFTRAPDRFGSAQFYPTPSRAPRFCYTPDRRNYGH